jgi:four helix bundle protein
MAFMFGNLQVYQKGVDMGDQVAGLTEGFPRGYYVLVDHLNCAALSIATNVAEGNGGSTKADRRDFFGIARGSVRECVALPELGSRQKPPEPPHHRQRSARLARGGNGPPRAASSLPGKA